MSWLPSGLTSLTGQITSFTKEVLSEGTEEIDDHVTELRVAKSRVKELELTCATQRSELDRLKYLIDELTVQLQSKELQLQSNASDYRIAMDLKEKEVKELKQRHADFCENFANSNLLMPEQPSSRAQTNTAKAQHNREFGESLEDFHDVISSQHEINHLRNEVRRLEAEVGHWRCSSDAQSKTEDGSKSTEHNSMIPQLQSQISDLQRQLADEVDRHQHELSALQDAHRQTMSAMKKSHKAALDQLQQQLQLKLAMDQPQSTTDHSKAELVDELQRKLNEANSEIEQLLSERQAESAKQKSTTAEIGASLEERADLARQLSECKQRLLQQEQELKEMKNAMSLDPCNKHYSGFMSSTPVAPSRVSLRSGDLKAGFVDDSASFEELSAQNHFLDEQVKAVQGQIEKYEQELEQFELVRSDWQMEKQALEGVLKKLREELREKEGELSIIQARKGPEHLVKTDSMQKAVTKEEEKGLMETKQHNANIRQETEEDDVHFTPEKADPDGSSDDDDDDDDDDIKVHAQKLDHQVELLASENAHLEADRDRLELDKEQLMSELEQQQHLVKKLELELKNLTDSSNRRLVELEAELMRKTNDFAYLEDQLKAKQLLIDELTVQLDQRSQVKRSEDTATLHQDHQEESVQMLPGARDQELEKMKEAMKELESWKDALLEDKKQEVEMLRTEKQALEESMEELDASHQEAVNQIVKSRADVLRTNETLKQQIICLEQQLTDKEKQNEELLRKFYEDEEKVKKLEEMENVIKRKLEDAKVETAAVQKEYATNVATLQQLQADVSLLEQTIVSQRAEIMRLQGAADQLEQEKQELSEKLKRLEARGDREQLQFGSEEQVEQLKSELESSKLDVASLLKDLTNARNSLVAKQEEMQDLAAEVEMLRVQNSTRSQNDGDLEISKLQARCIDLEKMLDRKAASFQHSEKALEEAEKAQKWMEEELGRIKEEAKAADEMREQAESVTKLYEAEVERLTAVEEEHLSLKESFKNLQADAYKWKQLASSHQDSVTDVSTQEHWEQKLVPNMDDTSENLENHKSLVDELQRKIQSLESEISVLKERNEMKRIVEGREMTDDNISRQEVEILDQNEVKTCGDNLQNYEMNGRHINIWRQSSVDDNVVQLKTTISQQEDLIKTLNSKYASMLRLLEDRSMSTYGSTVLADMHQLETEVQVLRAEKEHMMSVLNEKTREASSLKGEVHRLMSVVSAGKAALAKLQQDTRDMARNQDMSNMDMKKEAIKKLSQLVKDRDIEIEALKEKNSTLLQVLQSSSSEAATHQISMLIEERDDLQRQITAYQNDRDQIINTLNVKHQESVSYYSEVERLGSIVTELTEQKEKLDRNYSNLTLQYEDKQKSLVKALNELTNYKQRLAESEKRVSDAQERLRNEKEGSGIVDQSPITLPSSVDIPDIVSLKQSYETALAERDERIGELGRQSDKSEQLLYEKEQQLNSKEQEASRLSVKLHLAEANVSAKESELSSVRKQCENLTFQLQGLTDERMELRNELDELRKRCESLMADIQLIRQANNAMTVALSNKDLEIATLTEKVRSLESVVQQRGENAVDGGQAEVEHLMREIEMLKNQGHLLQQDRDHLYLAIHQFQAENTELKNELGRVQEKEKRLAKECDRLRGHLLVIEEGHTREALEAEEREKELRNRLAAVEEKALSSNAAIVSARSDASRQVENLQIQLHAIADQRDNALLQLANAQETITSYASSLTNLQMVLEQFQAERQHQQMVEIERYKRDLNAERAESRRLGLQLDDLQKQLDETLEALAAAERLSEQLDKKEGMIAALREEVLLRENELSKAESELRKLTSSTEAKVDKVIVKSLFLGYFHAPTSKRPEAIRVIGQILSFTKEDMEEISRSSSGSESWIGGLFWKKSSSVPKSSENQMQNLNQSFSEMFVKFLERESTPQPQLRLPAELMAQEQQDRRHQQQKAPAFNPFSTPVDSAMPLTLPAFADASSHQSSLLASANASSHLLMGPISSSRLPIFAPATMRADTPVQGRDSSATSSGRSTPSGSGSVLRDILQQR